MVYVSQIEERGKGTAEEGRESTKVRGRQAATETVSLVVWIGSKERPEGQTDTELQVKQTRGAPGY